MGQQQQAERSFLKWSQDEWKRAVIGACVIGAAWGRFEYKSDNNSEKVVFMIEKHIIQDNADKKELKSQHDNDMDKVKDEIVHIKDLLSQKQNKK